MLRSTTLLLFVTSAQAWRYPNRWAGPGSVPGTTGTNGAGDSGEPYVGYHIRTLDSSKSWDAMITRKDGSPAVQNQLVVPDAAKGATPLQTDPADGIAGAGENPFKSGANYGFENDLFTIPDKNVIGHGKDSVEPNAGYPVKALKESYTSVMQAAGYLQSEDGVMLTQKGQTKVDGYNKLTAENDYTLLYFGASWCPKCELFKPRFAEYYKEQFGKQPAGKSFDVVFFSNDNTQKQYDESIAGMPWKVASFEPAEDALKNVLKKTEFSKTCAPELSDKLQGLFNSNEVPCVVVLDKQGKVITTDGVNAIKGLPSDGKYPLPSGEKFFADAPILPNNSDCVVDEEAQRIALKENADASVDAMDEETLKVTAKDVAHGRTLPTEIGELRQFVRKAMEDIVDKLTDEQVQQEYAGQEEKANDPSNYVFKEGDYIRVVHEFTSDPERSGSAVSTVPEMATETNWQYRPRNQRNTGKVMKVGRSSTAPAGAADVANSIQVQFMDNQYARRWLTPEHFKFIEKIPESEARAAGWQ